MSTIQPIAADTAASLFGILYAEDFDDPRPQPAAPPSPEVPTPDPVITTADVQDACAAAVRAARLDWQASQEQSRLNALASLTAALSTAREAAAQSTLDVAEATVTAILAMVSGLLPHFCREHGPAEVRALLAQLLPTIRSDTRITVRVHPDLVPALQQDVAALEPATAAMVDVLAAPLAHGDVKVNWNNGSLSRDTRQITQAISDALGQLGLRQPVEATAKRRMAYAD